MALRQVDVLPAQIQTASGTFDANLAELLRGIEGVQGATLFMVVAAHAGTNPTLDVTVQERIGGFTGATVATFTQVTVATQQRQVAAAGLYFPVWRISWTIGGTAPSFDFRIAAVINP